jgi:hypothetical protein
MLHQNLCRRVELKRAKDEPGEPRLWIDFGADPVPVALKVAVLVGEF